MSESIVTIHKFYTIKDAIEINQPVKVYGWVDTRRDHGSVMFWDLRRDNQILQVVLEGEEYIQSKHISSETVVEITGIFRYRSVETVNDKNHNGDVEIKVHHLKIITEANTLPFAVDDADKVNEDVAQKYRYLCFRKGRIRNLIKQRAEFFSFLRHFMEKRDFVEFNTPILTASSPEGARDFLVPSRLHPGKFYALPQSPQIFKQLLMLGGFDRYYQLAPCFRDEDARIDRSPTDFYQLDFEIAFATQSQVLSLLQELIVEAYGKFAKKPLKTHEFPIFSYREAMEKYGSDKPDLRNQVKIMDCTDFWSKSEFKIFKERIQQGDVVKGFLLPKGKTRSFFDGILDYWEKNTGMKLAYTYFQEGEWCGPIAKFMVGDDKILSEGKEGMIFFCQNKKVMEKNMAKLHKYIAVKGDFFDHHHHYFCFVVDFPMYEYDDTNKRWDFCHNPFAMPKHYEPGMPMEDMIAQQYDLVGNGIEMASGAIRNHDVKLFEELCGKVGYTKERLMNSFPAMMEGFQYGTPIHGGAAPGIERLLMEIFEVEGLKDIIPFPLLQNGRDLMMNAPSFVGDKHLKELHIKVIED
jgi:aspartyl-tRNA synthetase